MLISVCVRGLPPIGRASLSPASHFPPTSHRPAPTGFHEIKHDGFGLMARRDPVGIRQISRREKDWTTRYPLVAEAVNHLKVGPA
jgi:ATP-dependent DNA ligase